VNVGVTLALVLTITLVTVRAYRFMMWFVSRIRLAITARFLPTAHTNDDKSDADDSIFAESDKTTDEVTSNGLTQVQENEGAPANTVAHNATTNEPAEDSTGNNESSSAKNNAVTDDPVSSISEHEGDSPVTSHSSVQEVEIPRSPPI
jgi:FtsZ-interacting cell division protein ZipA